MYVSNAGGSNVSLVAGTSTVAWVSTGENPGWSAYDPSNGLMYVPNGQSGDIAVLNGSTVVSTIQGSPNPFYAVYDGQDDYLFVVNTNPGNQNGSVSVIATPGAATYSVTFTQSGLPPRAWWAVTLASSTKSGTGTAITFVSVPNGTYNYSITPVKGYSTIYTGHVAVNGAPVSEHATFIRVTYTVTFTETGLASASMWSATLNGTSLSTTAPMSIAFAGVANGSYSFTVEAVAGYRSSPSSGSVTVNGAAVSQPVIFTQVTYSITFTESGLPFGTSWSVTLNAATKTSASSAITFTEPNGTYSFTVGAVSGYTARPSSGNLTVQGADVSQGVTLTSSSSNSSSSGFLGLPGAVGYYVLGGIAVAIVMGIGVVLFLRRRG